MVTGGAFFMVAIHSTRTKEPAVNFESFVTATILTVMTGSALYAIEPAVTAAAHMLVVINQLTDKAHNDAARQFCQQLDVQTVGDCAQPPAGYLDYEKKRSALEEAALLGQPVPEEPASSAQN